MGFGSEDWYVAWGAPFVDFFARADEATPRMGFATINDGNDPHFRIGGSFGGRSYGAVGYAGALANNGGKLGPRFNSYSKSAGVIGTSIVFTGVAGTSVNNVGVYGQTEEPGEAPGGLRAGVVGMANRQPGVIGYSREGDGLEGATFTGTAIRAASFFGPGIDSISGALTGVRGVCGTQGPPPQLPNLPNVAGVIGSADQRAGVIGTSNASIGVYGFSSGNAGVVGQSVNSFAGYFAGNVAVTGNLTVGGVISPNPKLAVMPFPDGTQRALYCMESPEVWFEDFGAGKLKRGRAVVKIDADFAKVIKRGDYRVFLTPEGDCRGLYARRKANSFEVRELADGKSSVAFSYRIVGRRKDIKGYTRFAKIDKIDTRIELPDAPRTRKPTPAALPRVHRARRERGGEGQTKGREESQKITRGAAS
jgi:hypothetical protein